MKSWHNIFRSCRGSLQWRHNEHEGVSNHQPHDCLFNLLFMRRWNITAPRHWPLLDWIGLFNDDTRPTEHISRPTQVGSLTVYNLWQLISDRRIRLLVKIPLCKSQESSQRGSSESQQCSIHPEFPAELHIPRACGQWSTSVQNDCK